MVLDLFSWTTFDVEPILPDGWAENIHEVAHRCSINKTMRPTSVTSRERTDVEVSASVVSGEVVDTELPWLTELYRSKFTSLAATISTEPVHCATNTNYGAVLNVQSGSGMRYEAHVDSNPIQGMLYTTSHLDGRGALRVARNTLADSKEEIDADFIEVLPVAGRLVLFDARRFPHYVTDLAAGDTRVAVAMNFYTPSCSEDDRPADLNQHLFGTPR